MKAILITITEKIRPIPDENYPAYNAGYETKTYNTVVHVPDEDLEEDKWLFTYFDPEIHDVKVLGELPQPYANAHLLLKAASRVIEFERSINIDSYKKRIGSKFPSGPMDELVKVIELITGKD